MNTRSSEKYLPWLLEQSVVETITGSKPPTVKMCFYIFVITCATTKSKKGFATEREAAKLTLNPHCESLLSDEDRMFSNNMKTPENRVILAVLVGRHLKNSTKNKREALVPGA